MKQSIPSMITIIMFCAFLFSCETEKSMFKEAQEKNTIEAFKNYISAYPEGKFTNQAMEILDKLEFDEAKSFNTVDSYRSYILNHPNGKYIAHSMYLLEELEFSNAQSQNTVSAYKEFIIAYPNSERFEHALIGYIRCRITDLYQGIERDPLGKIVNSFNELIGTENMAEDYYQIAQETYREAMNFNTKMLSEINADTILYNYFSNLFKEQPEFRDLSIENVNYYSPEVRELLETKLGVDIQD